MKQDYNEKLKNLTKAFSERDSQSIDDFAEEAAQSINYLDLKKTLGSLNAEMEEKRNELKHELSLATENGMTPEVANRILDIQKDIETLSQKAARASTEIDSMKNEIRSQAASKLNNVKEAISKGLNKAKDGFIDKVVSGVAATAAIGEKVKEANRHALAVVGATRDTAYTNVTENVAKISRNWMSFNFNVDKSINKAIENVKNTLEKAFERKATIKEAFKDLGRSIVGKDRQNAPGELKEKEKSIIGKLNTMSADLKQEMQTLEKNFNLSKEISMQNINSSKELREGAHMKESNSLEKRFAEAKAASIASKAEKQAPAKDDRSL